jgi:nucleotide-binding universal stress UspA family protein
VTFRVERIVVGIDGSDSARRALEWAITFAGQFAAEVIAVHAVGLLTRLGDGTSVPSQAHLAELRRAFETEWCQPLAASGISYRLVYQDGPPVPVLLTVADTEAADLIVVGSRGTGGFPELRLGSTSHQVAEHSGRPVLIVPPDHGS